MKRRVEIGILFSRSGSYPLVAESCRAGALRAIRGINADPEGSIELVPVEADPGGNVDRYAPLAERLLRDGGVRHIVGCVTSWSRKEVIPVLEKLGGALWYACPYEGFEANEHVVYMHACPNQHLVPLLAHVVPQVGGRGFLLGSNYIWGWETSRVARDLIADAGGAVLGERYLPIGETEVTRLIEEIRGTRPSFVLNNLIGTSSYAFLRAFAELARGEPRFRPESCPVLSCNLTECELPAIAGAAAGQLSVGPYFRSAAASAADASVPGSSLDAAASAAVEVLAALLTNNPDAGFAELSPTFAAQRFRTALGAIDIDPQTQHATLPVVIGKVEGRGFREVSRQPAVAPDPYLSRYDRTRLFGRPRLKAVS